MLPATDPAARGLIWLSGEGKDLPAELRYPQRTMLVVGGIPGAGKTWLCSQLPKTVNVVDIDDFWDDQPGARRHMCNFDEDGFLAAIDAGFASGQPVAIQLTAMQPQVRADLCRRAEKAGYQPHLLIIDVDVATAVASQRGRERQVPTESIIIYADMWERFKKTLEREAALRHERYASIAVLDREAATVVRIDLGS